MTTHEDLQNDLTRNFMPASQEEIEYLHAIATYLHNKYIVPLQTQIPAPAPKPQPSQHNITPRPGASWNNSPIRQQKFESDWSAMKKNGITSVIHDNPHGWDNS